MITQENLNPLLSLMAKRMHNLRKSHDLDLEHEMRSDFLQIVQNLWGNGREEYQDTFSHFIERSSVIIGYKKIMQWLELELTDKQIELTSLSSKPKDFQNQNAIRETRITCTALNQIIDQTRKMIQKKLSQSDSIETPTTKTPANHPVAPPESKPVEEILFQKPPKKALKELLKEYEKAKSKFDATSQGIEKALEKLASISTEQENAKKEAASLEKKLARDKKVINELHVNLTSLRNANLSIESQLDAFMTEINDIEDKYLEQQKRQEQEQAQQAAEERRQAHSDQFARPLLKASFYKQIGKIPLEEDPDKGDDRRDDLDFLEEIQLETAPSFPEKAPKPAPSKIIKPTDKKWDELIEALPLPDYSEASHPAFAVLGLEQEYMQAVHFLGQGENAEELNKNFKNSMQGLAPILRQACIKIRQLNKELYASTRREPKNESKHYVAHAIYGRKTLRLPHISQYNDPSGLLAEFASNVETLAIETYKVASLEKDSLLVQPEMRNDVSPLTVFTEYHQVVGNIQQSAQILNTKSNQLSKENQEFITSFCNIASTLGKRFEQFEKNVAKSALTKDPKKTAKFEEFVKPDRADYTH